MRKKGEKGAPTPAQMKRAKGESIDEINVPAIIKSVISRMTHPKGYAMMLQKYVEMVKDGKGKGVVAVTVSNAGKDYVVLLRTDGYSEVSYNGSVVVP